MSPQRTSTEPVAPIHVSPAGTTGAIPPVPRVPIALARRYFQICTTVMADEALAAEGLTPLQFAVLAYLNTKTGEPDIDQNGLAARMGVDRSHASLLVEQLVVMGLVGRRVNGDDRRAVLLRLTPAGERLHRRLRPKVFAGQMRVLAPLAPAERELLLDMLVRVVEGNRSLARPGAGRRKRSRRSSSVSKP